MCYSTYKLRKIAVTVLGYVVLRLDTWSMGK